MLAPSRSALPRRFVAGLLLTTTLAGAAPVFAQQNIVWRGDTNSDWGEVGNWDVISGAPPPPDRVPRGADTAFVTQSGAPSQPVIGAGDIFSVRSVIVASDSGPVSLTVNGTLGLGDSGASGSLRIASGDSQQVGTVVISGAGASIGRAADAFGAADPQLQIGDNLSSDGTLRIENGGTGTFATLCLACGNPAFAGAGLIEVTGAGSTLNLTSRAAGVRIGNVNPGGGIGRLRILDGGRVIAAGGVGGTLGLGSSIEVRGTDGAGAASHFQIGTSLDFRGAVIVADGGHFEMTDTSGANIFGDEASLTLTNGGRMDILTVAATGIGQQTNVLITGAGTQLNLASTLAINSSTGGAGSADFVIADGAVVNVNTGSESFLAFGEERLLSVTGATLNMTGGLRMNRGNLTATNATLNFGSGRVSLGSIFDGNTLSLFNTDITAGQIATNGSSAGIGNVINLGGTAGGPAGEVGAFNVAAISLNDGILGAPTGEFVINHVATNYDIASNISGTDGIIRHIAGDTIFSGTSSFAGITAVTGGSLRINGTHGAADSLVTVGNGAVLGGSGTIGGDLLIRDDGRLAPGNGVGTLRIRGGLSLSSGSILDFELGAPNGVPGVGSDLIIVDDNLFLIGTLNVIDAGGFGPGLYTLISVAARASFQNHGLTIGAVPTGFRADDLLVQVVDPNGESDGAVNLLVGTPDRDFIFWDGSNTGADNAIAGGSGRWTVDGTNWTVADGSANGAFDPEDFLIFSGTQQFGGGDQAVAPLGRIAAVAAPSSAAGTVTIDNSAGAVSIANGVQFAIHGYTVTGDALTLAPGDISVRVGDGTAAGADFVATIAAPITGGGRLVKTDLGTLILSGANDYSGGTAVNSGRLQGDTVSLQGNFSVDGTLTFDQRADGSFAGTIDGTGLIEKEAAGVLTMTGDSSLFTGTTAINAGALRLDGQLGGTLRVNDGTRLGGIGGAGVVQVASGGTVAPGTGIGTLNVAGIAFDAGSVFAVELNDGGNVAGINNDHILSSGPASIAGGTVHVAPANGTDNGTTYAPGSVYTILTAQARGEGGGVSGRFDSVTDDFAFLDFLLSYDSSHVFLTSQLVKTSFCLPGMTFNQCSTGEGAFSLGGGALFNAILPLSDAEAPVALDQLSGEIHASAKSALINDSRFVREAALDRLASRDGPALWGRVLGSGGHWSGDGNAARQGRDHSGWLMGADTALGDAVRAGVIGGVSRSSLDVDRRTSDGRADSWHLGFYAGGRWGGLSLRGGAAMAWHDVRTDRAVLFTGFSDALRGRYRARTVQYFAEAAYRFGGVEPYANFAHVRHRTGRYAETGGAAALTATGRDTAKVSFSTLGVRLGMAVSDSIRLDGNLGWRHAFGADRLPRTFHAFAGGNTFEIRGTPIRDDSAVIDAGLNVRLSGRAQLGVSYNGQLGSGLADHGGRATLSIQF
ncbi:MAG: autotransporter domain-containing protein [Sphingopyxis sp.]|uniref:autotransporter domain-containing protein n=1 Tax=Sphingopyxis sp. TaxID=1908224 RepID=UPI0032EFDDBA